MGSVSVASSQSSNYSSPSPSSSSLPYVPPSPASFSSTPSASSSKVSFDLEDEENVTITANRSLSKKLGKQKSLDDIRLLAISTHMTELSFAISDMQTRIFEIQELRHKSQSSGDNGANTTTVIDQSLMTLDERLESVEKGIKTINETLEPLLQTSATPTVSENGTGTANENAALLRKHATLLSEWEAVQNESEVLREELKEDKWLTVFRTVTDQADGMMSSLEKAVNRCQEFIWQVHKRGADDFQSNAARDKQPASFEVFTSLLDSYEAKKKHYMPATSKVLSIIDKGVRDRVTKNGETLRRHAESAQRWKSLRERITRTDTELHNVRKVLLSGDGTSDHESTTSGTASTKNGHLATPPSGSRASRLSSSASSSISGSISPFRKFARKITGSTKGSPSSTPVPPLSVSKKNQPLPDVPTASSRRSRASLFSSMRGHVPTTPLTPATPERERIGHKYSQSYTPDSSPRGPQVEKSDIHATVRSNAPSKQPWNSSTRISSEDKAKPPSSIRRPPSASGNYASYYNDIPPVPPIGTPYRRSTSRASMASSRPWSPVTSSISTTYSSSYFNNTPLPLPTLRTPSRAQTPSRAITPALAATPRSRPKTPSHIPGPAKYLRSISGAHSVGGWDDEDTFSRSGSPAFSTSALSQTSPSSVHLHPRPPSRSMIPVPSLHLYTPSRPGTSMSNFSRSESPTMRGMGTFRGNALRAQTPEYALRARAQLVPVFQGPGSTAATPSKGQGRPSISTTAKLPPSSFREGPPSARTPSRPGSRTGVYTPSMDANGSLPLHEYIPASNYDPLDVEVAAVCNSLAHGLLVERVDPPLKRNQIPKEGDEVRAQYAFSSSLSRKVVTCRLTTMVRSTRTGGEGVTKKVMCRVGGGWQDLSHYILNRQAGL